MSESNPHPRQPTYRSKALRSFSSHEGDIPADAEFWPGWRHRREDGQLVPYQRIEWTSAYVRQAQLRNQGLAEPVAGDRAKPYSAAATTSSGDAPLIERSDPKPARTKSKPAEE